MKETTALMTTASPLMLGSVQRIEQYYKRNKTGTGKEEMISNFPFTRPFDTKIYYNKKYILSFLKKKKGLN